MSSNVSIHKAYSTDGIELDAVLFEPEKPTKKIVVHVHGKEGHFLQNHFIHHMGEAYPKVGYSFLTFNNRGHDYIADLLKKEANGYQWHQGGSVFDDIEEFPMDMNGVLQYVQKLGYEEVVLQGHSLGPHKICYYLSKNPQKSVVGVILLTTADIHYLLDTQVPNWQEWSKKAKEKINAGKERDLMPVKLWSDCPVSAKTLWSYTKPDTNTFIFNATYPQDEWQHFNKVTQPMLVINPENDFSTGSDPERMIELLKKNSSSVDLSTVLMQDVVHNFLGKEEELINVISEWLSK